MSEGPLSITHFKSEGDEAGSCVQTTEAVDATEQFRRLFQPRFVHHVRVDHHVAHGELAEAALEVRRQIPRWRGFIRQEHDCGRSAIVIECCKWPATHLTIHETFSMDGLVIDERFPRTDSVGSSTNAYGNLEDQAVTIVPGNLFVNGVVRHRLEAES